MRFKWPGSWVWRFLCAQKMLAFDSGGSSEPHNSGLLCADPSAGAGVGPGELFPSVRWGHHRHLTALGGGEVDRLGCSDERHTGSWVSSPPVAIQSPFGGKRTLFRTRLPPHAAAAHGHKGWIAQGCFSGNHLEMA